MTLKNLIFMWKLKKCQKWTCGLHQIGKLAEKKWRKIPSKVPVPGRKSIFFSSNYASLLSLNSSFCTLFSLCSSGSSPSLALFVSRNSPLLGLPWSCPNASRTWKWFGRDTSVSNILLMSLSHSVKVIAGMSSITGIAGIDPVLLLPRRPPILFSLWFCLHITLLNVGGCKTLFSLPAGIQTISVCFPGDGSLLPKRIWWCACNRKSTYSGILELAKLYLIWARLWYLELFLYISDTTWFSFCRAFQEEQPPK